MKKRAHVFWTGIKGACHYVFRSVMIFLVSLTDCYAIHWYIGKCELQQGGRSFYKQVVWLTSNVLLDLLMLFPFAEPVTNGLIRLYRLNLFSRNHIHLTLNLK